MTFYEQIRGIVNNFSTDTNLAGKTVVRTPVTKTLSNTYGDETLSTGTNENIDVYFVRMKEDWMFNKEGEVEGGDAFMQTKYNQTINKNDIITYASEKYRVENVYELRVNGELVGKNCNLFLIE
jgi:hypothetical protein